MPQFPVLDRIPVFDPRSRMYGIRPLVAGTPSRKTLWPIPAPLPLNQGSEGACVGFGWSAQLSVGPIYNPTTNDYARTYYEDARLIDRAEGRVFSEGASVLAGAKVAQARGLITAYRWAFGVDDVVSALCAQGPVLLGLPWYESMYGTLPDGRVVVNGQLVGGHCILATGFIPAAENKWRTDVIQWVNSWGPTYGFNGVGYISRADLASLLSQDGEALIADEVNPEARRPWWWRFLPGSR